MTDALRRELQRELPFEHEQTIQIAFLRAAGLKKNEIVRTLGIDVRVYEVCSYRIRAITRDSLRS